MLVPLSFNRRPGEVRRCRASSTPVAPGRGPWHEPEPTRWPPALRAGALPSELSCRAAARAGTSRRRPDSNRWVSALQADGSPAASHLHRQCACARTSGPGGAPGEIRTPTPRRDLVYSQAGQPIAQPTRVREGVSGPCRSFRPAVFHCPRGAGARVPGGTACSPPGEPRAHPDQVPPSAGWHPVGHHAGVHCSVLTAPRRGPCDREPHLLWVPRAGFSAASQAKGESNPQPAASQTAALSLELFASVQLSVWGLGDPRAEMRSRPARLASGRLP